MRLKNCCLFPDLRAPRQARRRREDEGAGGQVGGDQLLQQVRNRKVNFESSNTTLVSDEPSSLSCKSYTRSVIVN